MMSLPLILGSAALAGLLAAYIATRRDRNPYFWFMIGFVFGLVGVMAIFIAPDPNKKTEAEEVASQKEPEPYIEGPIDRFWYYLDSMRQQKGPMSHDALTQAWKKGEISPNTYVWHEQLSDWKELQELIKFKI
jgi:hypothetical protein